MRIFSEKKQFQNAISVFLVIAASILFALFIFNFRAVWSGVKTFLGIFTPFYIGFIIAYLMNPILKIFEDKVFLKLKKRTVKRTFSTICTYLSLLIFLILFFSFVLPNLYSSLSTLITSIPQALKNFFASLQAMIDEHPTIASLFSKYSTNLETYLTNFFQYMTSVITNAFPSVVGATVSFASSLANFFIGLVVSIYMLLSKEKLIAQLKKLLYFCFGNTRTQNLLRLGNITHEKTCHFLVAQISISLIDAALIYLFSVIFNYPYPLLFAALVAVFNLIPFFGPVISCVPCALITLIYSPAKAIYFVLFFILVQQVEANIYGPKIQGKKLNISALWIIFGVLLFGGIFGIFGMIVGVPFISVSYMLLREAINNGLEKKGYSTQTEDYDAPYPSPPPTRQDTEE